VKRREFISLIGSVAATWPLAGRAQQTERMRRIGVLMGLAASDPDAAAWVSAFQQVLRESGWTEGRNIKIEYRWGTADARTIRTYAAELIGLAPEVIVTRGSTASRTMQQETNSIPQVFLAVSDPVGSGFVPSWAHPSGNITGFANHEDTMAAKWLELLKEIAPQLTRVAVVHYPENPPAPAFFRAFEEAAQPMGVQLTRAGVHDAAEIERAITAFGEEPKRGLIVLSDVVTNVHRELIIRLAARYRLPAVYGFRYWAKAGGLASYGADVVDQWRGAAAYVDRILKGEKPGNLPVQAPTKFELVVNLKTAKALGLEMPTTVLARADEVIE
jgi:putative tryptophan/tyrosine transport system substrate-binding protein